MPAITPPFSLPWSLNTFFSRAMCCQSMQTRYEFSPQISDFIFLKSISFFGLLGIWGRCDLYNRSVLCVCLFKEATTSLHWGALRSFVTTASETMWPTSTVLDEFLHWDPNNDHYEAGTGQHVSMWSKCQSLTTYICSMFLAMNAIVYNVISTW